MSQAASGNDRKLTFHSKDLGKDVTLMLTFNTLQKTAGGEEAPLCWKVISLNATGIDKAEVQWSATTAFFIPQIDAGNLVESSNGQVCSTGETCSVQEKGGKAFVTSALPGTPGKMMCINETDLVADIGIGFVLKDEIEPGIVWKQVASQDTLVVELTPKLRIYANRDYKETEILRGQIVTDPLFDNNLMHIMPDTHYTVSIPNPTTGKIVIEPRK